MSLPKLPSFLSLSWKLAVLSSLNIGVNFAYQWFIVTALGATGETDALFAGMVVPQLVLTVVSSSLMHALVPILTNLNEDEFGRSSWNVYQGIGLLFAVVAVLLAASATFWVKWTVPGFDTPTQALTIKVVRIQLVSMVFTGTTGALWSANYAKRKFIWVELSGTLTNAAGLALLVATIEHLGVIGAAWILVFKSVLQNLLLIRVLGRYHIISFDLKIWRDLWRKIAPLLAGTTYYKTDKLVDRVLASFADVGSVTILHVAQRIYASANLVLNKAIAGPMVPLLSKKATEGDWTDFDRIWKNRFWAVVGIALFVIGIVALIGVPILRVIFGLREFDEGAVQRLWITLIALGGLLAGGATGQILSSAFYAQGDTRTPTKIGVVGFTVGIGLKIGGFFLLDIVGLALGTTLYYFVNAVALYVFLTWKQSKRRPYSEPVEVE